MVLLTEFLSAFKLFLFFPFHDFLSFNPPVDSPFLSVKAKAFLIRFPSPCVRDKYSFFFLVIVSAHISKGKNCKQTKSWYIKKKSEYVRLPCFSLSTYYNYFICMSLWRVPRSRRVFFRQKKNSWCVFVLWGDVLLSLAASTTERESVREKGMEERKRWKAEVRYCFSAT